VPTEQVYVLLVVAVVLVVVVVGIALLTLNRIRRRKTQLLDELKHSPRLDADRAFNRVMMTRREEEIVARQGADTHRAREQIALAQSALDLRQFDRAYELATSAHESLVKARQGPIPGAPLPSAPPLPASLLPEPVGPGSGSGAAAPSATVGIPRGRVESQFEMRLLDSDLEEARARRPTEPATLAGIEFQTKANAAFDVGDYSEAFRLALKGRRGLGGRVETVAPGPTSRSADTAPGAVDPSAAAESAASSARCPSCGYPVTPSDAFCRGCGTPRTPTVCSRCGAARAASDTFCGRCGERFN
jgi:hypothetical protein